MSNPSTYVVIQNGTVINVILWDGVSPWVPPTGCTLVNVESLEPQPGIGWSYDGTNWTAPQPQP